MNVRLSTSRFSAVAAVLTLLLLVAPEVAHAYGGPGSVISGIGTFLALLGALLAALFGFIWYPLKRLYQKVSGEEREKASADATEQ